MNNITITEDDYKTLNFSGGEVHVELLENAKSRISWLSTEEDSITLDIRLTSSNKVMQLIILNDIFKRYGFEVNCVMQYVPYARQDRETIKYGPTSLKVFASLINSCKFKRVYVVDPHSIAVENLIDNVEIVDHNHYILRYITDLKDVVILAPDIGSIKRCESLIKCIKEDYSEDVELIVAHKTRDPDTGNIKDIKILGDVPKNKKIFVVDDICDGGRTFTELLDKTKLHLDNEVHLWVTHGIFSKGDLSLFNAGYKTIGTTNSFRKTHTDLDSKVKMFNIVIDI